MDKLKMHSPDFVEENIARLAELFPNCVTEVKSQPRMNTNTHELDQNISENSCEFVVKKAIDFDLLRQELSTSIVEGPQERYHLNWPGKREALLTANAPIAKTLRPCREESVDFDTTENLFIEGDNLDALKLLQETYLGKVKMIYIDPPYNTGKDFIYADNFSETTEEYLLESGQNDEKGNRLIANTDSNGRFHSDWLSMMYSRLKLARNLLKNDGVIFISIDDGEVSSLRKLCDEVFGMNSFLGLIPVINNMKGRNDKDFHAQVHEYIIAYEKECFVSNGLMLSAEKRAEYNQITSDGKKFQWRDLRKRGGADTRRERPNLYYPIYVNPDTRDVSLKNDDSFSLEVLPVKSNGEDGCWRWGRDTLQNRIAIVQGRPVRGKESWNISYQVFLDTPESGEKREKPKSVWMGSEFSTDSGTKAVNSLLPGVNAKEVAPKAVGQIRRMAEMALSKSDIVLDFFAGSATTAHAVMQLNAEDNGKRKFIMVQLPEACDEKTEAFKAGYKTIAEISKERIRRAGKKIKEENAITAPDLDIGFRVLKVDSSNMADIYYTPDAIEQDLLTGLSNNIKDDRSSEDLLFQVILDWGSDLISKPIKQETIAGLEVFFVENNQLAACFAKNGQITENFCKELAERQPLRVVFRDSGFKDDSVKINVEQIFKLMSPHTDLKTI